ncbi:hypothetical protein Pelo_6871 [Pelomyxa schiedti]|nr:hypothetical protein Pelo_6871 [Pelomyxa schiedti]
MQACPPSSSSSGSSSSGEDDAHVMALSRQNTVPVGSVAVDPTTGLPVFVFTSGYQQQQNNPQQQPLVVNYPSTQQFYQNGTTKSRSQKRNNGAKLPRAVVSVCSSASSPYCCINKGSSNYAPSANPLGCFTPFPGIVTFPQNDPTMWIRAAPQSSVWSGSTHLVHPQPAPRRHSRHLHPPQVPPAVSALETEYQAVASTSTKKPTKRKTKGSFGFVEKAQTTDGTAAARAEPEKSETRKKPACSLPSLPSPSQTELMPPPKINKTVNGDVKNSKIVTSSQHCSPAEHTAIPQKDISKKRCSDMNPENAEDPIINNSQEIPSGDLSPDSAESDISNPHQTTSARPIQQHAEVSSELNGKPSPPHQVSSQIVITTPQPQPQPAPLEVPPPLPASPSPPPRQSEAIIINITSPAPPDLSPVLSPSNKDASSSGSSSSVSSTGDPSRLPNEIDAEMKEVSPMEPLRSADATENNTWRTDASTPRLPSCAAVVPDLSNPVGTFGQEKRETAGVSASSEEMLQQQVPPSQAEEATEDEAVAAPLFDILQQFLESQTVMDQAIEQSGPFHPLPLIATNPEGVEEQEPIRNGSSEVPPAQQSGVLPHSFQPPAIFSQYAYGGYPPETNGFAGGDSQQLAHSPSFNADPAAFPSQNLDPTQEVNQLPNSYSGNSVFTQSCAAPLAGTTDPSNHLGVMPMPSPACVTHPFLNDTSPLDPLISSLSDFMFPARPIVDKAAFLRDLISSLEKDSASAWERRDFSHQIVLDVSCQLLKGRYLAERYTLLCTETNAVLVTLSVRANNKEKAAPSQAPPASSGSVQQPPHESPLLLGPPLGAGVDFDDSIPFDNIPLAHQPYQQQYAVQVFAPPTNTQPQIPQPPTPLPVPLIQQQQPPAAPPPQPQQQQLPAVLSTRRLRRKMERLCIWHGMQLKYMETMLIPPQRWTPYGIPPLPTTQFPHCCFTVDDNHVKELWQWVRLCRAMLESEPSENTPSRQSPGDSSNS